MGWNGSAADAETATGSYVYFNDFIDFGFNQRKWGFPLVEDSDLVSGKSSNSDQTLEDEDRVRATPPNETNVADCSQL